MLTAERLMLIGGLVAFLLTIHWVRRRDLREKYAVGWLVVAFVLLLIGFFPSAIMAMADGGAGGDKNPGAAAGRLRG